MSCDTPESDEGLHMTSEAFAIFKHAATTHASAKARFQAAVRWARSTPPLTPVNCASLRPIMTVESQQNFLAAKNTVPKAHALDAASSAI